MFLLPPPHRFRDDSLVLVASQELRETALSPTNMDTPPSCLSDMEYSILEVVGAARHAGVPRPFFSLYLQVDPRSGFHYVKILSRIGFVTIQVGVSVYRSCDCHMTPSQMT